MQKVDNYLDLTDEQIDNLSDLIGFAKNSHYAIINQDYNELIKGKSLAERQNNTLHSLMNGDINFDYFRKWTTKLLLNQSNDIFVFEPLETDINIARLKTSFEINDLRLKQKFLFDYNKDNLNSIELVEVEEDENEVFFSFISPVIKLNNKVKPPITEKELYFFYMWYRKDLGQIVLSLPSITNIVSFDDILIKRHNYKEVIKIIENYFAKNFAALKYENPAWILKALHKITNEYYDHNNDIIYKKMDLIAQDPLQKVLEQIQELDSSLNSESSTIRINKKLKDLLENEFIIHYGHNQNKDLAFEVFLHEADNGEVNYIAQNKATSFSFADSREIIKKMLHNSSNSSIGLSYNYNEVQYPYKVFKEKNYFTLKNLANKTTDKEVVDDVLRRLNEYKQGVKVSSSSKSTAATE